MSRSVGCRHGWDPMLLWQWHRPEAGAPIRPLARELPWAPGVFLKSKKKKKSKFSDLILKPTELETSEMGCFNKPSKLFWWMIKSETTVLNPCVFQGLVVCSSDTNLNLVTDPEWGPKAQCQGKQHSSPSANSAAWPITNKMHKETAAEVLRDEMLDIFKYSNLNLNISFFIVFLRPHLQHI